MAFIVGHKKRGGIQKGGKHKETLVKQALKMDNVESVSEVCAKSNVNPVQKILDLINTGLLKPSEELDAWKFLTSYLYAKPQPIVKIDENTEDALIEKFKEISTEELKASLKKELECERLNQNSFGIDLTSHTNITQDKTLSTNAIEELQKNFSL